MPPGVTSGGNLFHDLSVEVTAVYQADELVYVLEVVRFVLGGLAVVDDVAGDDGHTEVHGLDERGVGASGAVTMYVDAGVGAQRVEYVEVVYGIEQMYVGIPFVLSLKLPRIFAVVPVAYKDKHSAGLRESLEDDVAVVLRLDTADRDGILTGDEAVSGEYLACMQRRDVSADVVSAIGYQLRGLAVGLGDVVLYAFVVGNDDVGIAHGDSLGVSQHPARQPAPLGPAVFEPVDVDYHTGLAEPAEQRQEETARDTEHKDNVKAADSTAQRDYVVWYGMESVGVNIYISQLCALVFQQPRRHILGTAEYGVADIGGTVVSDDVLDKRFESPIAGRHPLCADDGNFYKRHIKINGSGFFNNGFNLIYCSLYVEPSGERQRVRGQGVV